MAEEIAWMVIVYVFVPLSFILIPLLFVLFWYKNLNNKQQVKSGKLNRYLFASSKILACLSFLLFGLFVFHQLTKHVSGSYLDLALLSMLLAFILSSVSSTRRINESL